MDSTFMQQKLLFNPAITIYPFDSDSKQEMVMCKIPTQSEVPLRYALPASLLSLLESFDGSTSKEEAIENYSRRNPGKYTPEKLGRLIDEFLCPKGVLIDPDDPIVPDASISKRRSYLYCKVRLIPARAVSSITPWLGWLFNRWVFFGWLPILLAAHVIFYLWVLPQRQFNLNDIRGGEFILILLLASATAFFHEWGHASAFTHYGCQKAEIGWGLYLFFCVFYTDVSEAWKLNRKQRAMIDIAGVYFQSIGLVFLLCLFWVTGAPIFLYTFFFIDLELTGSLNPFLRTDGYWLVTDLFGIPNLRKQSLDVLKYSSAKLLRFETATTAAKPFADLSRKSRWALYAYVLVCVGFMLLLFKIMINQFVYHLIPGYPPLVMALWRSLQEQPFSILKVVTALLDVLWRSFAFLGLGFFLYNLISGLRRFLKRLPQLAAQWLAARSLRKRENAA